MARAEDFSRAGGQVGLVEHAGPHRIADVVGEVGDCVRHAHHLRFEGELVEVGRVQKITARLGVVEDGLPRLVGQVESGAVLLKLVDGPQALLVVPEAVWPQPVQHLLADVSERRMADVVPQSSGLR